jgi:hypothetical protein
MVAEDVPFGYRNAVSEPHLSIMRRSVLRLFRHVNHQHPLFPHVSPYLDPKMKRIRVFMF